MSQYFDAHLHVFWVGEQLMRYVDVSGCGSVGEVLEVVARRAGEVDGWVLARGLDQDKLREGRFPTRGELDAAAPGRAVVVGRVCGHVGVVSSVVGVASENGVVREGAFWEVIGRVPKMGEGELEECVRVALGVAGAAGLSGVCTMIEEARQVEAVLRMGGREGGLPMRVTANIPGATVREFAGRGLRSGMVIGEKLKVGAAKFFSDGTLGARTALLSEDYSDAPGERGLELLSREKMTELFAEADGLGFQVSVHAIGDVALRSCLGALEPLTRRGNPLRHRVEHVSVCPDECLAFMAERKIWAVVQPQFAGSDAFLGARLGEGRKGMIYRFAEMHRAGVPMAFSSDAPVEKIDPAATMRDAVGAGMRVEEAEVCYTRGSESVSWW